MRPRVDPDREHGQPDDHLRWRHGGPVELRLRSHHPERPALHRGRAEFRECLYRGGRRLDPRVLVEQEWAEGHDERARRHGRGAGDAQRAQPAQRQRDQL